MLTQSLKNDARDLGFGLVGVAPAVTPEGLSRFHEWLTAGYAGEMHYFEGRRAAYEHPRHVLDGVRSIIMLGMHYRTEPPRLPQPGEGRVARYAWNVDYHDLIRERLNALAVRLCERQRGASARGVVDTAPLLEREIAQLAGLGWIGKNTLLLNKSAGSYFFLAALLTDLELEYDQPHESDHCGTCRACLDACPTDAFVDAYRLDARRCISYLTIEHRSPVPVDLRSGIGDWLFGCDVCQEVCPWNHRAPQSDEPAFQPAAEINPVALAPLFHENDEQFRARFRHTPLWRPKRRGLLRNAAIVLGNGIQHGTVPEEIRAALACGLQDSEPLVRGAAAWALGQCDVVQNPAVPGLLSEQLSGEADTAVRSEIEAALLQLAAAASELT